MTPNLLNRIYSAMDTRPINKVKIGPYALASVRVECPHLLSPYSITEDKTLAGLPMVECADIPKDEIHFFNRQTLKSKVTAT